jgi:protein-S-isoprenylcysteine O-methyltransferase Ste14
VNEEEMFRWLVVTIFAATFALSAYFRRKARRSGEVVNRLREGRLMLIMRLLCAAPLYLAFLAYMANPRWMSWSSVPLPAWLRWLAAAVGLAMLPALYWVVSTLGKNISETVLTKDDHQLVTAGPYRWVRHPLYAVATISFLALGIVAANWFIVAMAVIIIIGMAAFVIPREEAHLLSKFGDRYRAYMERTGALAPRLKRFD